MDGAWWLAVVLLFMFLIYCFRWLCVEYGAAVAEGSFVEIRPEMLPAPPELPSPPDAILC